MKKNYRIQKALSELTEFPTEAIGSIPIFTIKGRGEAEISGCRGILEYDDGCVVLKCAGMRCTVRGKKLLLSGFHNDTLTVCGEIDEVRLTDGENRGEADV